MMMVACLPEYHGRSTGFGVHVRSGDVFDLERAEAGYLAEALFIKGFF